MKVDACFQLGYVTGTHGLNGGVSVFLDTDRPENYKDLESVYLLPKGESTLIPFFINHSQLKGDKAIIKFEEIATLNQARELIGSSIYLPLEFLPPLDGDQFYYHELVSWKIIDQQRGALGSISSVNHQSPQIILIMDYQNKEVLIPYTKDIVTRIDRAARQVHVILPEGLLEIYLQD